MEHQDRETQTPRSCFRQCHKIAYRAAAPQRFMEGHRLTFDRFANMGHAVTLQGDNHSGICSRYAGISSICIRVITRFTCMYMCVHTCTCTQPCMHACMHTCIHTYFYLCTYTFIPAWMESCSLNRRGGAAWAAIRDLAGWTLVLCWVAIKELSLDYHMMDS